MGETRITERDRERARARKLRIRENVQLMQVEPALFNSLWPIAEKMLEKAFSENPEWMEIATVADIEEGIKCGIFQLWLANEGKKEFFCTMVTELVKFPQRKVCRMTWLAGCDLHEIWDLLPAFEQWAVAEGATMIGLYCRPGIAKLMQEHGYRGNLVYVRKEITKQGVH